MGNFIYIMGKSSSGKDTINKKLQEKLNLTCYVMYTTRPIREGEQDGVDYFYITDERMQELKKDGKVIESRTYQTVAGPWTYATVDDGQFEGKEVLLGVGTLESYKKVKEYFDKDDSKNLLPVYIQIDEEERLKRALERELRQKKPNIAEVERRIKADNLDFTEEKLLDAGIGQSQRFENYDLEKCVESVVRYIEENTMTNFKDK